MRLSWLILVAAIAGIGALALFACAPTAPVGGGKLAAVCVGTALQPVPFIKWPYDPTSNTDPTPDDLSLHPVNPAVQADLAAAFAAVPSFQTQLCRLDGIFIDPSGCTIPNPGVTYDPTTCNLQGKEVADRSWGLRTYPPNAAPGKRYIGISLGLWNNGCQAPQPKACAPPFDSFKTLHVLALLDRTAEKGSHPGNSWSKKSPPSHSVEPRAFATSSANSLLAVLAHEYGHVLWFDDFVVDPSSGQANPGGNFVNKFFCGGNFYPQGKWGGVDVDVPRKGGTRWADFGDISPAAGPDVQGLPNQIDIGGYPAVAAPLHKIHLARQWASLLAAFSSNEDFVETFELSVLHAAGLKKLTFKVPSQSDVVFFPAAAGSGLAAKLSCFP